MPMVLRFVGDSNQTPALTINTLTATISNRDPQAGWGGANHSDSAYSADSRVVVVLQPAGEGGPTTLMSDCSAKARSARSILLVADFAERRWRPRALPPRHVTAVTPHDDPAAYFGEHCLVV